MRNAIVATAVALTLWTGPLPAATRKGPSLRTSDRGASPGSTSPRPTSRSRRSSTASSSTGGFNPVPGSDLAAEIVAGGTAIGTLRGRGGQA